MKNFYRSALCIFIVFSLDDEGPFLNLNKWINDVKNLNENDSPIVILIGNKKDNLSERKVSMEDIDNYCKKHVKNMIYILIKNSASLSSTN